MPIDVVVGGEFACFTRPEMKVERVSYDVMTPSAARGILEAIFWKPAIRYRVEAITPLKPVQFIQVRRSEVKKGVERIYKKDWQEGRELTGIDISDTSNTRVQRASLLLKDVAYRIQGDIELVRYGRGENRAKYYSQFERRVDRGQCYRRPYLGCREFSAWFREPTDDDVPVLGTRPLGRMLFDLEYEPEDGGPHRYDVTPHFFFAKVEDGVLHVPQEKYDGLFHA